MLSMFVGSVDFSAALVLVALIVCLALIGITLILAIKSDREDKRREAMRYGIECRRIEQNLITSHREAD